MIKTLSLILPVLIPSWRFFKTIEPSPRVEWMLIAENGDFPKDWQPFRPKPLQVTWPEMVFRLFWNPQGNEDLFVVSCAERIAQNPTDHSIQEIQQRIQRDCASMQVDLTRRSLRFRLVFVHIGKAGLNQDVLFVSDPFPATAAQS